jgi:hypothetical protein
MTQEQLKDGNDLNNTIAVVTDQISKIKERSLDLAEFPIDCGRAEQIHAPAIVEKLKTLAIIELELYLDLLKVKFKNL